MNINGTTYFLSKHMKERALERVLLEYPYDVLDLSDIGLFNLAITNALPNIKFVWKKTLANFHGWCCTTVLIRRKRVIDVCENFDDGFVDEVMLYLNSFRRHELYQAGPQLMKQFGLDQRDASLFIRHYLGEFYL